MISPSFVSLRSTNDYSNFQSISVTFRANTALLSQTERKILKKFQYFPSARKSEEQQFVLSIKRTFRFSSVLTCGDFKVNKLKRHSVCFKTKSTKRSGDGIIIIIYFNCRLQHYSLSFIADFVSHLFRLSFSFVVRLKQLP